MNPYLSWAIVLVFAGSLGFYYRNGAIHAKGKHQPARTIPEKNENTVASKKAKRKVKKSPDVSSGSGTPTPSKPEVEVRGQQTATDTVVQDEVDNKEFARQFANVKKGTDLSSSGKNSSKKAKPAKKKAVNSYESSSSEVPGSRMSTRTSSTTGADADDDLSPVSSPIINPAVSASGDVSDMLEAPAPGASVLRVTGDVQNEQAKKKKQESFKQVETKKQRQQRAKNENKRAMVEEAEKQRRVLLEKQLHAARESERREAVKSSAKPQPPATNVWTKNNSTPTNGVHKAPATATAAAAASTRLLDTFDPTPNPTTSESAKLTQENIRPSRPDYHGNWTDALPSEEEQMRILGASTEDEWTTVSGRKKEKRKGNKSDEGVSDTSSSEIQPVVKKAPAPPKFPSTPDPFSADIPNQKGHPLDSDWAA